MRRISFGASDEEVAEIDAYCAARHLRDVPEFARMAVFAYMRQNRPGAHRAVKSRENAPEAGRGAPPLPTADNRDGS
jgi:hypothetical protein